MVYVIYYAGKSQMVRILSTHPKKNFYERCDTAVTTEKFHKGRGEVFGTIIIVDFSDLQSRGTQIRLVVQFRY